PIRTVAFRIGSLNDANRWFLTVRATAEYEDRIRKRIGYEDLIISRVVPDVVHRPAQHRRLPVDSSGRRLCSICQPGKCRNLRMGHSVRHQNLLALAVIADSAGVADHQTDLIGGTSSNDAERGNVAISSDRKNGRSEIAHVR